MHPTLLKHFTDPTLRPLLTLKNTIRIKRINRLTTLSNAEDELLQKYPGYYLYETYCKYTVNIL